MATHGELTVKKLKQFLAAFSDDTKVVLGSHGGPAGVIDECHANTYYPPNNPEKGPWVIIDPGKN